MEIIEVCFILGSFFTPNNSSSLFLSLLQNVLRELEQKKPQLDDLVRTAENLRESPIKQQIPAKGQDNETRT